MTASFTIDIPRFDPATGEARFSYWLEGRTFLEVLDLPVPADPAAAETPAFRKLLALTAFTLGVSYFKLKAPFVIAAPDLALTGPERAFVLDLYENGLGEFYARNDLRRFGRLRLEIPDDPGPPPPAPDLPAGRLVPIGGGKDSLLSAQLLEAAGLDFTPFAVNPKGPILGSIAALGRPARTVSRRLDPEMLRLSREPGYYNGHVPSTAINSMIAALTALLAGYDTIILSNERSASEANTVFDGREANHQYSKSLGFERAIAAVLAEATGGALKYFSLLRPYSEARIARLFARDTRFDHVFSSCNRNFRLAGHEGALWCGDCPKCHFVFLIFAPVMDRARLTGILGSNPLADPAKLPAFRELTGLSGQKPWECVGEILEAAACLFALSTRPEWRDDVVVRTLRPELEAQYGAGALEAALEDLMTDSTDHLVPAALAERIAPHAL